MILAVSQMSNGELLNLYSNLIIELRARDLVRTANNPVADLGELMFCGAMQWQRQHQQGKNYDATTLEGARVQIKSRRLTRSRAAMRTGTIYDKDGFDLIALAMFATDFEIARAIIVPRETALVHLRWSERQSGWFMSLTKRFWSEPKLVDVTDRVASYGRQLFAIMPTSTIDLKVETLEHAAELELATP